MTTSVAIVDAYSTGASLGARLAESGVRCVHVATEDGLVGSFRQSFRPDDFVNEFSVRMGLSEVADRLRDWNVSHIIAGTETGVETASVLARALGLPANTAEAEVYRNKVSMERAAANSGLRTAYTAVVRSVNDVSALEKMFYDGGRVVVKPVSSAGSNGVSFCSSVDSARAAVADLLGSMDLYDHLIEACIVQEYLEGPEFYVNSVSANGEHFIAEVWRYTKTELDSSVPVYDFEEPVDLRSDLGRSICAFVGDCLDGLGVCWYAAHTEVFLCGGEFVLGECAARLGGATAPAVIERVCGGSQTAMLVSLLVDGVIEQPDWPLIPKGGAVRNTALINPRRVVLESGSWTDWLGSLETVMAVAGDANLGGVRPPTVDLLTSPGFVIQCGASRDRLIDDYRRIRKRELNGLYGDSAFPVLRGW